MGRGRQKAKQQKIARKLKYLTTDTDYDELAKELGAQEPGSGSFDPFADIEAKYAHDVDAEDETAGDGQASSDSVDDLDEYAKWAAEAAAKATSGEFPAAKAASVMYFSTLPMVTAPKPPCSRVQAPSHNRSCGQTRPQISGSELVRCDSSAASNRRPRLTRSSQLGM